MKIHEAIKILEDIVPLGLQESYDNSGLLVGESEDKVKAVLCTLDITPEVIDEAITLGANLIISHHPIIFEPITSLTGKNANERAILKAIRNNIAIYAAHTNLDNSSKGLNRMICEKLGLINYEILSPMEGYLFKLVTFVPENHALKLREALFRAGAGHIGNYDSCSFNQSGKGTFRAGENSNPFIGEKGKLYTEDETRIETIVPKDRISKVVDELKRSHPYEEVAYDIYPLTNRFAEAGLGMIGEMNDEMQLNDFLELLKGVFGLPVIRYAGNIQKQIKRVSVCGGSGIFLLNMAIHQKADAFLTGDIKYHQFFEAEDKILVCDIGHYESEQFAKEIFYLLLNKKNSTFAVHLSKTVTNPIKYYK
jgi:dinuclear metal center YbgI/SA1388 family protein